MGSRQANTPAISDQHSEPARTLVAVQSKTVAVIEDDATIANAVAERLRKEGLQVVVASDGPSGVELCRQADPDLVVLDVMLPGFDGLEVCRRIQKERPIPVLMLTARDTETDMLVGLGVGADDYMTKPFSVRELVARVNALFRRVDRASEESSAIEVGDVSVDADARKVEKAGVPVHLTPTEFDLLVLLCKNRNRVLTREQLLEEIWGVTSGWSQRTVDSHVASLRRKLRPDIIRTVHGVGYALGGEA